MNLGPTLAVVGQRSLVIGQAMLQGITPGRFARLPLGPSWQPIQTNHPAFVFGHLALYPSKMCTNIGDDETAERAAVPEGWEDLLGPKATCLDDPDGSIYPPMEEVVEQFTRTHELAIEALKRADGNVFDRPNPHPAERMRQMMPTVGAMATFYMASHTMLHIGQVSAWRRVEGLGSAM